MRELMARAAEADQSGASIWSTLFKAAPTIINGVSSLFGGDNNQQQKREIEEVVMRALFEAREPMITAGISKIPLSVYNNKREFSQELYLRDDSADQSGASFLSGIVKAIPTIVNGIGSLFDGGNNNQRREVEELVARELMAVRDTTDQSGASFLSGIVKAIPTIVNGISSLFGGDNNQQQKRDIEHLVMREMLVRAAEADESGASIWSGIIKAIPTVVNGISSLFGGDNNQNQKREVEQLLMRELLARAAEADESGASLWSGIIKAIPTVVNGISSLFDGNNNNKREVENLLMREIVARAAEADESGASIWSTLFKAAPTIINGISSLFGGDNNNQQQKRELENFVMRELFERAAEADQSGASLWSGIIKAIPTVVNGISSLFGGNNNNKRDVEDLIMRELVVRAAEADESGASIWSTLFKAAPTIINGISSLFGGDNNNQQQKRELESLVMRELLARAAEADESGASIWSTLFKAAPTIINGISSLFGGDNNNQQREVAEIFARAFVDDVVVARRCVIFFTALMFSY